MDEGAPDVAGIGAEMVPASQAFTRWMANYSVLISKLFQREEPRCSKGSQSILILVTTAGPAIHPHSGTLPHCWEALDPLPWSLG